MRRYLKLINYDSWPIKNTRENSLNSACARHFKHITSLVTGLPVRASHKMGFRSSVSKSGLPGEGRHEGLVPRNDVLTNGFI